MKCFLLAYELLNVKCINDIVDLQYFKDLLCKAVDNSVCRDIAKYGVEYVPMPSDFFSRN